MIQHLKAAIKLFIGFIASDFINIFKPYDVFDRWFMLHTVLCLLFYV